MIFTTHPASSSASRTAAKEAGRKELLGGTKMTRRHPLSQELWW
jgi:hypothetical protein